MTLISRAALALLFTLPASCAERPVHNRPEVRSAQPSPQADPTPFPVREAPPAPTTSSPSPPASSPSPAPIPEDMRGVPGGRFFMGQDDGGELDERPRHPVLVQPFLLDLTEVTHEAYYRCVEANVCRPHSAASAAANKLGDDRKFRTPTRPISGVSHDDAQTYCRWLGKRLPSEAEWERAARGSDGRTYPWGNEEPTHELAVFGGSITQPVGSTPNGAGPYGHLDLAGNVWEWVEDHYDPYAYRRESAERGVPGSCDDILKTQAELRKSGQEGFTGSNPIPEECEFVLRGGAFNYGARGLRSSNRVHHPGRFRLVMSGFRCAKDWPDGPTDTAP